MAKKKRTAADVTAEERQLRDFLLKKYRDLACDFRGKMKALRDKHNEQLAPYTARMEKAPTALAEFKATMAAALAKYKAAEHVALVRWSEDHDNDAYERVVEPLRQQVYAVEARALAMYHAVTGEAEYKAVKKPLDAEYRRVYKEARDKCVSDQQAIVELLHDDPNARATPGRLGADLDLWAMEYKVYPHETGETNG